MNKRNLIYAIIISVILCVFITSCGQPGEDGTAFVAIEWVYSPQALYFPVFPNSIITGEYIEHDPGVYMGEYIDWDGSYWSVTYEVTIDEGGEPGLFTDGLDGEDKYFSLWLYSFGPGYYQDRSFPNIVGTKGEPSFSASSDNLEFTVDSSIFNFNDPEYHHEQLETGGTRIDIQYRGYRRVE